MLLIPHLTNADAFPQFIVSKIVKEGDKVNKVPCNPRGITADHKDSFNWLPIVAAYEAVAALGEHYRLGFSITAECHYFLLDIDKCFVNGQWTPLAVKLCKAFAGCFMEISQSGTGLHIMGRYTGTIAHRNRNTELGIELYTKDRFVMFGGIKPMGDWNTDATVPLHEVVEQYFKLGELQTTLKTSTLSTIELTDEEVIERCKSFTSAAMAFGDGPTFLDLYECNVEKLATHYETKTQGKLFDASAADLALANMIAHQTRDKEQIIRIMWTSKLVREKWITHKTYLSDTVDKALSDRTAMQYLFQNQSTKGEIESQPLNDLMPPQYQDCFYVMSEREIYSLRYGLLNAEAFNICYAGEYLKEAPYKTFRKHAAKCNRLIDTFCFRPDLKHGEIVYKEDISGLNIYKPVPIAMKQGNMELFFRFFDKMIPNPRDQQILLTYAAVLAQKPGIKSQWCPVIQGVQGCGKSLFADFVSYACGQKYTHRSKGDEFENRFNSQWFRKTLILVEDPQLRHIRLEEALKPLITSRVLSFEGKGVDAYMGEFPANFIITLNNFDSIQKKEDTRRLSVFMSALQSSEDLIDSGLTPDVYRRIINWRDNGGYEIFAHFIHNYVPLAEFDFSGSCVVAPETSTTAQAMECSRPEIELRILEEVELGRQGFKNGWISSTALTDFLFQNRLRHLLPDSRRKVVLQSLGYISHPGLFEGRAVRNVLPDNKRPRLYVKKGHSTLKISDTAFITDAYEKDQQ